LNTGKPMNFNLHEFSRKLGRREYDRFIIPGASISWKLTGQESFPDRTSPLSDISKGGLSLLTNDPPSVGSEVSLLVSIPQKTETLELLGKVIYSVARGPRLTYKYRVGVALRPFDEPEGNSLQALNQIEALDQIFGKHKKS
jgi:Tfp pilus assembly protein PilZ